jgi:multiple sugar transport system substrate-binding protein
VAHAAAQHGLEGNDFPALLWQLCHVGTALHAIPIDIHPLGLYINVDVARRAGLDPRRAPAGAAELLGWDERMTDRTHGIWGYAAPAGDVECVRQWFSLLYQFGGRFMSADGSRCVADSAAGRAAFAFLRDTITVQRVAMPLEGAADADFLSGKVAMYAQGPWYIHGMLQQGIRLTTAPLPRIGRHAAVWANSHVLGVVNSQNTDRIAAAMRFIAWMHAHALDWASAGQVPASNAARARLAELPIWPYLRPFATALDKIVYQPQLASGSDVFAETLPTPLTRATRAVMLGRQTPAQATRAMSDEINQLVSAPAT